MHTDEAVHAVKFGTLLEENAYQYDPVEYHGPTLNYLTLIPAWITSANNISGINEATLRIVPVLMGILLILALFLLKDGMSRPALLLAGLFTAVSPAMVFYSRYYVQEMLLVFFTFGVMVSGFRYLKTRRMGWALSTGIFLGLMHATKETSIIAVGAMGAGLVLTKILHHKESPKKEKFPKLHILITVMTALIISILFYSSFFSNPAGILDSIGTYKNYFLKAGGHQWHDHPFYYYFKLLIGSKHPGTPLWSEAAIIILSLIGMLAVIRKKIDPAENLPFSQFILFYTLILTIVYSLLPYKTPWSMLGFYHGWILMAGIGSAHLLKNVRKWIKIGITTLLIAAMVHLLLQSCLGNFKYEAHPSNPYVYGHTSMDIFTITRLMDELAEKHPDGRDIYIEVICPDNDYWPLPWYLRSFSSVGWYSEVDLKQPPAPVIIASPKVEPDLIRKLYEIPKQGEKTLYLPLSESYLELRPQIEIRGYVRKDIWDILQAEPVRNTGE